MPAYRFRWDAFDEETVVALAKATSGSSPSGEAEARAFLSETVKRPRDEFVGEHVDTLRTTWLPKHPRILRGVVERLVERGVGPRSSVPESPELQLRFVRLTRNCASLRRAILDAMVRFGDVDPDDEDDGFLRRFAVLDPKGQPMDARRPHAFQEEAWSRLDAQLLESVESGIFQGLLVMPTGSGKTYTSVRWLVKNVVDRGGRVLWVAHQQELLSQAAAEFHRLAGEAIHQDKVRVRVVSAAHCGAHQIDPADDVVVASIHVLARRPETIREMLQDNGLFVVIDEAHHAPATSYKNLIDDLEQRGRFRLLGLTATPTRTMERERVTLARLFGGRIIHQVDLATLIEQRILATPHLVTVETGTRADADLDDVDRREFLRFHQMTEHVRQRLAEHEGRNACIVGHYLERREAYGPTLVFALDVAHAARLADRLHQHGVRAEYVASSRPLAIGGEKTTNEDVLQRFRAGEIDVLVNMQMLTEGVDLPAVKTVFLARPTTSEILVRQMIGRALRGVAAGGTDIAYIVTFEDHWAEFTEWQEPMALVPDIVAVAVVDAPGESETEVAPPHPDHELSPEDAALWRAAMAGGGDVEFDLTFAEARKAQLHARHLGRNYAPAAFEAVPEGRYALADSSSDEPNVVAIVVYPHQQPFWEEYRRRLAALVGDDVEDQVLDELGERVFADCDDPRPSLASRTTFARFVVDREGTLTWHGLASRRECDPTEIARVILEQDMGARAQADLVSERYRPLARAVYRTEREFRAAVAAALDALQHPAESDAIERTIPVFEQSPSNPLAAGPHHDLAALFANVLAKGRELLELDAAPPFDGTLAFTNGIIKGYAGQARYETTTSRGAGSIRINRLYDSPDVPAQVVEFVLWHEYLHLFMKCGHSTEFRRLERAWPGWLEADRFLDGLRERFGIEYRAI